MKELDVKQQQRELFLKGATTKDKGAGGYVKDAALSLLADGVVGVGEAAVGLANIPTLGRAGKFLEDKAGYDPKATHEFIGGFKTEKSKEQLQDFTNTEGFGGKLNYARKNPSLIVNTVAESLPSMFAGGAVGRGLGMIAPKVSGVVAGALGEGALGAGLQAESIRQQTEDGLLTPKQAGIAAATGATTAGFGYAGGRLAKELGIGDFDTIIAGGGRTANPAASIAGSAAANASKDKGILRRGAEGALSEGLLEELPQSVSETILQNEALGRPLDEGVTDAAALGLLSGAAMGAGAGAFARNRRPDERITPTEDMGQEDVGYGSTNPLDPSFSPAGLLGNQAALQLGFQGRATNQFNAGPDGEVFTGDQYNEYLAQQQERARTERDANQPQPRNFDDVTQAPQGYDQYGNDPRLPAPNDFTVTPDGTVQTGADVNTSLQNEQQARIDERARRARGEIVDRTPVPEAPKPSELMGLDANKGSLSAAAVLAVDSGASEVGNQMRDVNAEQPMSTWQSGMMDRLDGADQNNSTYARLAQAVQNEPTSLSEKARLMREANDIPKIDADIKQIKPNTRVLDEARAQTRAYTPEGNEVKAQWDVVDASDLVTSNTDNFTINPNFPASRQPRDRTRASAQQQVNEIASKLQPNILGESPDVSTGAPFVGATDNVVDSGNGRSMAIRKVYQENGAKAQEYRQFVNEQASKFGLDTDAVNMMQSPVLVRRNTSDMNRDEFARAANKPTAARMSSTEQAASDAKNLPDASLLSFNGDGNMSLYQSQSYLKNFVSGLPSTEQSAMMDESDGLSREGKNRIEAAIVQDAYSNPKLVSAISEKLDNDTTNVLRAITDKAPQISQLNSDAKSGVAFNNTLARDIADATQAYMDIKNSDKEVSDYLSQDSLLDDGLTDGAKEILSVLSDNRRSAKAIGENIQQRINAVTGKGNPKQGGLSFDDIEDTPNVLSDGQTSEAQPLLNDNYEASLVGVDKQITESTQLTNDNPTVNIPAPRQTLNVKAAANKTVEENARVPSEQELSDAISGNKEWQDTPTLTKGIAKELVARGALTEQQYSNAQTQKSVVALVDKGLKELTSTKTVESNEVGSAQVEQSNPPKSYAQFQTEVADEMGITTNEDGEYDITDAQFDAMEGRVRERMEAQESQSEPQSNVEQSETVAASPTKPPQSSVVKSETAPEAKKPVPKKSDKPAATTEPVAEIEDFGEKITGARKDMDSFHQKEISDDDIINEPLSKIWPKKDVESIEDKQQAALATVFRVAIPTKPRKGYKLRNWVNTVKTFRGVMQAMLGDSIPFNKIMDGLMASETMRGYAYHAKLLNEVDRNQWSRITMVDPRIGSTQKEEDGTRTPFMGFVVTIDKKVHILKTKTREMSELAEQVNELLEGETKAPALKFDLYSRGRGDSKSWFITQASDKDKTPLIEFNDRDTARAFLKDNNNDLSELWDQHKEKVNVKKSDIRSKVTRDRIGLDHRGGLDVTTEQFMEAFGLRGGQFGNWVTQNAKDATTRQSMLNDTYDAFMDLAGVLGIPSEAIGLGGKLGMSFGARGKGAAMAHYEPSQVIINLTKTKGAGSLAHEWFHALDNHFTSFRDDPNRMTSKESAYITYKPEPMLIMKDQNGKPSRMRPMTDARRKQIYDMNQNHAYLPENFMPDPNHKEGVRPKVEEVFADLVKALDESPMKSRAMTIDKGAVDGYWSRIIERAARAFESYIINKLDKQGARSDFLANVTPEDAFPRNMDRYPYLLESEMAPVAEAFDNLFATIDSRASEDGNGKTLFSRAGQMSQTIGNIKANAIGSTNTTRQQVIAKLSDKFGKETISKLMTDGKLDIKVLSDFVRNGRLTIPSDVDGLYLNGKATLIADNLSDEMIIPTFLHELGGHGGMQSLMDKKTYNALMKDFDALVAAGDPLAVQAKAIADKVARSKQEALDEYLPYLLTLASRQQARQGKIAGMINRMVMAVRSFLRNMLGASIKINSQDILSLAERMVNEVEKQNSAFDSMSAMPQFSDPKNPDIRFSRAAGMDDQFDPRNIARESMTRLYDWASSNPPGKLSWWHKTLGTMYNLAQRNPYFKPVFENTEKFINDVSYYASKASEFAPRLLPQLDSLRDITKSAIGAKDNEALSKPIFEGTLLWGRDLDGKAVLIEDWRKKTMSASKQDRLKMLQDVGRITPAQLQELATLNNIQANRFINGIIDEEVNAGLVWTDNELSSKFDLNDEQIGLYREFRAATDKSLDSLTRSDMLRRLGKDANDIEAAVMEAGTLREAVFTIEQHINGLIQASPKKEKALKGMLKDIKESQFRTNKLKDDGYAPLSRFGQYTVDVVDSDGNREYFGMFESAYDARKMEEDMKALYDDPVTHTVSRGALSKEEFKLFAGVTPETAELFGEMLGLDATGDKAADEAFQEYLKRTKNNRSAMKRLMHRKGIKGYSEDVGRVLASFIYSNARHTSAALNMGNLDRSIADIPKGEGQLKDAAVKLAQYIKNPQEEGQVIRGWMFAQYLGGSVASAVVNLTQPIAVSFPYLSQFGGAVKAAAQLSKSSTDWGKSLRNKNNDHFEADLRDAIERAEADGTLSPQEVHNLMKMASGKNPLRAGDGTKLGNAKALAGNSLSRVSLAWGSLFSLAEQVNRRVTFVAAYRMAKEQGMDNPAEFATNSIKETQFVYNKASRMNWGRGAVGGTLMTFKTYTVSYMELMHRLWTQGEKGSTERAAGRKAVGIMIGTLFLLGGAGGLPFMEDAEDLVDGIGQIMGYNFSSKKVRQAFLDEWMGEMMGDFIDGGISSVSGSPTDVSGRLGLGNLIPGTGIFKERTSNSRDVLEIVGPAGDFVGRVATGTRDIAKGVANLDSTSLKKGALEFAPTAVRNAVKGTGMATSGIYKDTKGYKVADVTPVDAAFKFFGFQPRDISKIQEANYLGQSSTSYYNLRASSIRALWAAGVVEGNSSKVSDARSAVKDWNNKNPNQKIIIKPTDIARRVREMKMDKVDRVIKRAPKTGRGTLAQELNGVRDGM
jgi:hypothetical protein